MPAKNAKTDDDIARLVELMDFVDKGLPPFEGESLDMVVLTKVEDCEPGLKAGKLVVIGRAMFRRIRDALKE